MNLPIPCAPRRGSPWLRVWMFLLPALAVAAGPTAPRVAGLADSPLDPALKGLVLIEELNCAACHGGGAALAERSKKAPRLAELGARLNPSFVESFLRAPHARKPGTLMPDLLTSLPEGERNRVATELTHFLYSSKASTFAPQPPDAVAAVQGHALFHSRGCAACHSPRDAQGVEQSPDTSVPLGALEDKYSVKSLVEFLRQPLHSRPSGRMPDPLLKGADAERIAHFLLQKTRVPGALAYTLHRGKVWEGLGSEEVKPERAGQVADFSLASLGPLQHHSLVVYTGGVTLAEPGPYRFFLTMNGGSLRIDGKEILAQEPSDRRGVKNLEAAVELAAGWRKIELVYAHTGREPSFSFEWEGPGLPRGPVPSSRLSISDPPAPAFVPLAVDPSLAARGREHFSSLGCVQCHDDLRQPGKSIPAPAFAALRPDRGCLAGTTGPWPHFGLDAQQRGWIAQALPRAEQPELTDAQRLDKTLVTLNCLACHERAGLGGPSPERKALFTGTQPGLGDQGRLPPPLTHVGAKLTPAWLAEVLLEGRRQRDYVDATMPRFGEANVRPLVELFGKLDTLEPAALPQVGDLRESKEAGYRMIGSEGLSCIACHEFNGQKAGELSALDIAKAPQRLQKNWFSLYMQQPSRFHPTVIMPSYWPNGQSTRPEWLGGDTARQIDALWAYLQDGERARKPVGLSRESNELRVGDLTEICRGRGPAGYRGIGVGYPERINLAFDSGEMALRLLWKGEFANVDFGSFNPRGGERVAFAPGIPFHRLPSLDAPWPYKGKTNHAFPQDQGYQFRGYHLDAQRRPAFLYHYGEISVRDFFEDLRTAAGQAYFKRTLTFDAPSAPAPFFFRAATGAKLAMVSEREFTLDTLRLRITSPHAGQVREGDPGEVLVPLTLPAGPSVLTLEYQW